MKLCNGRLDTVINSKIPSKEFAEIYGLIGRGVKTVTVNERNEIVFTMTDGREINIGSISSGGVLPVATDTILGGIKVGENLKITKDGVLSVDTSTKIQEDNTKPITSGAVFTEIGNIEALLSII